VAAEIAVDDIDAAVEALERVIAIDPRDESKTRLELLRVRQVQQLTEAGRRASKAGRYGEAVGILKRALSISPASATVLRELALAELASGQVADAEGRLRKAVQIDPNDDETHAALGAVLETRGRLNESAAEYGRAAALDSKWRSKAENVRDAADRSGLPDELRELETAATVTRGQLAGLIGVRLAAALERAPKRPPSVATDIRTHWAAASIAAVIQAGVMDVLPNHTFQPGAAVQRSDLAQVTARLIPLVLAANTAEISRLQAAKPAIADVAATSLLYRPAALVVAAGAMKTDDGGKLLPGRPASGADAVAAIARLEQLAGAR
jgi:tetratricopeptide (TPR) repeat protein